MYFIIVGFVFMYVYIGSITWIWWVGVGEEGRREGKDYLWQVRQICNFAYIDSIKQIRWDRDRGSRGGVQRLFKLLQQADLYLYKYWQQDYKVELLLEFINYIYFDFQKGFWVRFGVVSYRSFLVLYIEFNVYFSESLGDQNIKNCIW